jgi:hypothetical protein
LDGRLTQRHQGRRGRGEGRIFVLGGLPEGCYFYERKKMMLLAGCFIFFLLSYSSSKLISEFAYKKLDDRFKLILFNDLSTFRIISVFVVTGLCLVLSIIIILNRQISFQGVRDLCTTIFIIDLLSLMSYNIFVLIQHNILLNAHKFDPKFILLENISSIIMMSGGVLCLLILGSVFTLLW